MSSRLALVFTLASLVAISWPFMAQAEEEDISEQSFSTASRMYAPKVTRNESPAEVDASLFHGAYSRYQEIKIPDFHGIAPQIGLSYSSHAKGDLAGVGWTITGVSKIELSFPDAFIDALGDKDDPAARKPMYLLDGEKLVPCATITPANRSPSCAHGGTHATRTESYRRVAYDDATETWSVWAKDGTRTTYGVAGILRQSYNSFLIPTIFGAQSIVDPNGNEVTISWEHAGNGVFFLDLIEYNPTHPVRVKFHYFHRPDYFETTEGLVGKRLGAVEITVDGSPLRGYRMLYEHNEDTRLSLLATVEEYGRDATLQPEPFPRFDGRPKDSPAVFSYLSSPSSAEWAVAPAPPGLPTLQTTDTAATYNDSGIRPIDLNGDGLVDFLQARALKNGTQEMNAWLNTGNGFDAAPSTYWTDNEGRQLPAFHRRGCGDQGVRIGDMNGDGLQDIVRARSESGVRVDGAWLNTGSGWRRDDAYAGPVDLFFVEGDCTRPLADTGVRLVDINGDGRADLLHSYMETVGDDECTYWHDTRDVYLNLPMERQGDVIGIEWVLNREMGVYGISYFDDIEPFYINGCPLGGDRGIRFLDFSGDGLVDMFQAVRVHNPTFPSGHTRISAWLNTGAGFVRVTAFEDLPHDPDVLGDDPPFMIDELHIRSDAGVRALDINNDGRDDLVQSFRGIYKGATGPYLELRRAWLSTGDGWVRNDDWASQLPFFVDHSYQTPMGYYTYRGKTGRLLVDIDGDGATDVVQAYDGLVDGLREQRRNAWYNPHRHQNLMDSATSEEGLREDVSYEPSTAWPSSKRPIVVVPTVSAIARADYPEDDARHVTEYSYRNADFDPEDRVFNGFELVTELLPPISSGLGPDDRPYREILFRQDRQSRSKPRMITFKDSAGTRLWQQTRHHTTTSVVPYLSLETERMTIVCEDGRNCVSHLIAKTYDEYGNLETTTDYGSPEDDAFTTAALYVYDPSKFIVDRVRQTDTYERNNGDLLRRSVSYYDSRGNLRHNYRYAGGGRYVGRHFEYYPNGKLKRVTDELGRKTHYVRDDGYYVNEIRSPLHAKDPRHREVQKWDTVCGKLEESTDGNNLTTVTKYDNFCRFHEVINPAGDTKVVRYWKNPSSGLGVTTNIDNGSDDQQWKVEELDGFGQLRETKREGPNDTSEEDEIFDVWREYDGHGRVVAEARPHYCGERSDYSAGPDERLITRMYYDARGRPTRTVFPDGNERTWTYDAPLTTTMTDERGAKTRAVVDVWGRTVESARWLDDAWHSVYYQYDEVGQLEQVDDEEGNVVTFGYDPLGRQISVSHPDTGERFFKYDAAGQLYEAEDAQGERTRTTYDVLGRVHSVEIAYGTSAAERYRRFYDWHRDGYHNVGRVTTELFEGNFRVLNYDKVGNVVYSLVDNGESHLTTWSYDAWSRVLSIAYPDGDRLGTTAAPIEYDDAGRLTEIPGVLDVMEYTADGRPLLRVDASGASVDYDYTPDRGFLERVETWSNGTVAHALSYTHKENGFVESVSSTEPSQSWIYDYDEAGRLNYAEQGGRGWDYRYTSMGNLLYNGDTEKSYGYPKAGSPRPHAPISIGGDVFSYDDNGNLLEGAGRTLVWNADGRLIAANGARFGYDGNSRRYFKSEGGTNTFYFDGGVEHSKGTYTKYISAGGAGVVAKRVGTTTSWLYADHLGSIVGVGDASGSIDVQAFRPYGRRDRAVEGERHGFTGQRHDLTGLIYLNDRYYDPGTAVFLSADRHFVGNPGEAQRSPIEAVNAYQYAANNPVSYTDPTGEFVHIVIGGAIGGVVGGIGAYIKSGGNLKATMAGVLGGSAGGAFVASGAGLVAAAGMSTAGSVGTMGIIGAAGGVGSSTVEQVSGQMLNGESFIGAVGNVDTKQQVLHGAVGMATGALGGTAIAAQGLANARNSAVNGVLRGNLTTHSRELASQGSDVASPIVQSVQQKIVSGMATSGSNTATVGAAVSAGTEAITATVGGATNAGVLDDLVR